MRLQVFNGSPRGVNSNTLTIVNHFLEEVRPFYGKEGFIEIVDP